MIKLTADLDEGKFYFFGLTEANLNRMEFNNEPIFFDFGYVGHPELFGLIFFMGEFASPIEIAQNPEAVERYVTPFLDECRGITFESIRVFPISQNIMRQLRVRYWGSETAIAIAHPKDRQMFFAGRDELDIESYFRKAGLITKQTKRMSKGFG